MSSPAANDLNRILLGSAIGAAIGLVLLALGVAILWNAADQKLREASSASGAASEPASAPPVAGRPAPAAEATASPTPYPVVGPAPLTPSATAPAEPPRRAATSIWRSIFDDEAETAEPAAPAAPASAAPRAAPPAAAPRPAPRPATPRRPPEAQRQDDSLFF